MLVARHSPRLGDVCRYPYEARCETIDAMHIPKPIRVLGYFSVAFTGTALFVAFSRPYIGPIALVLAPIVFIAFNIVGGAPIDAFDLWLRRKTRDPIWLIGHEGQAWLATEEGRRWSRTNGMRGKNSG